MAKADSVCRRLSVFVVLLAATLVSASGILVSQDANQPKFKGRLPAHYGDLVTEAQRTQIYAVQEKYAAQIDALKNQLEILETKRDKEIEAVLNAEQKDKLKKAQKVAAERRKTSATVKKAIEEVEAAKAAAERAQKKAK